MNEKNLLSIQQKMKQLKILKTLNKKVSDRKNKGLKDACSTFANLLSKKHN